MSFSVALDGLGKWETGKEIIDLEVTFGSGKGTTSIKCALSDKLHEIGKALINHAASIGGLQPIQTPSDSSGTNTPNAPAAPTGGQSAPSGKGIVSRGGGWAPEILALADAVAFKETPQPEALASYYYNNGIAGNMGSFTDLDIKAGGGFPASAGTKYNVGRYQFNRGDWQEAKNNDKSITGYSPEDQDKVFYYKAFMKALGGRGGKEALAGNLAAMQKQAGKEWASVPGSPYGQVQAGWTTDKFQAYYKQRLQFHKGGTVTTVELPK